MSLERILGSARKMGLPVIVTDNLGRDPFVVLPLEQFEALVGKGPVEGQTQAPIVHPGFDSVDKAVAEHSQGVMDQRIQDTVVELQNSTKHGLDHSDLSLEDRFYLEPVDDEG